MSIKKNKNEDEDQNYIGTKNKFDETKGSEAGLKADSFISNQDHRHPFNIKPKDLHCIALGNIKQPLQTYCSNWITNHRKATYRRDLIDEKTMKYLKNKDPNLVNEILIEFRIEKIEKYGNEFPGKILKPSSDVRIELLAKIGEGAEGVVFDCIFYLFNNKVKIKEIQSVCKLIPRIIPKTISGANLEFNNLKILYDLNIKVPKPLYHYSNDEYDLFVMERLNITLEELVNYHGGRFDREGCNAIFRRILIILEQIHNSGYIFIDLKPQNLMVDFENQWIYLIDPGMMTKYEHKKQNSKFNSNSISSSNLVMVKHVGTPRYTSIDAHNGKRLTPVHDLYCLGYMISSLYCGSLPWDDEELCGIAYSQSDHHPTINTSLEGQASSSTSQSIVTPQSEITIVAKGGCAAKREGESGIISHSETPLPFSQSNGASLETLQQDINLTFDQYLEGIKIVKENTRNSDLCRRIKKEPKNDIIQNNPSNQRDQKFLCNSCNNKCKASNDLTLNKYDLAQDRKRLAVKTMSFLELQKCSALGCSCNTVECYFELESYFDIISKYQGNSNSGKVGITNDDKIDYSEIHNIFVYQN